MTRSCVGVDTYGAAGAVNTDGFCSCETPRFFFGFSLIYKEFNLAQLIPLLISNFVVLRVMLPFAKPDVKSATRIGHVKLLKRS